MVARFIPIDTGDGNAFQNPKVAAASLISDVPFGDPVWGVGVGPNRRLPDQVAEVNWAKRLGRPTYTAAELNAMIAAASDRGGIDLQPGSYAITTPGLVIPNRFTLSGQRGVTFLFPDTTGFDVLGISGTEGTHTAFDANQAAGSFTVTLPSGGGAGFAVDDIIGLVSDDVVSGAAGMARELHQVVSISTDTLTLDASLVHAYNTADTAEFFKITPVSDITIEGLTLEWTTGGSGTNDLRGPFFRRALRCRFDGITSVNGPGVTLTDTIGCAVVESVVDGSIHYADSRSYGVTVGGSGRGNRVVGGDFRNLRHAFTTIGHFDGTDFWTGPFDTLVTGATGAGGPSSFATFDTHAHAYDTVFANCISRGPGLAGAPGFQDRGHYSTIRGCKAIGGQDRGIAITVDSTDATISDCEVRMLSASNGSGIGLAGPRAKVTDCRITVPSPPSGAQYGVTIATTATDAVVEQCEFILAGTGTVGIGDQTSSDVGQRSVRNTFRCAAGAIAINAWRGASEDDRWLGTTTAPFFSVQATARRHHRLGAPQTVTFASGYTPTPQFLDNASITLTGNITIAAPSVNAVIRGQRLRLKLIQNGTGGWTVTFNAVYKLPASAVVATTALTTTIVEFECDGTNWQMVGFQTAIPA